MLSSRVLSFSGFEGIEEILEKIKYCKADSISLVFPRNADIFGQRTDLQRLRDECEEMGKEIIIITLNATARKEIQSVGIPALPSLTDTEATPFEKARENIEAPCISYIPIDLERKRQEKPRIEKEVNPFLSKPTLHALFILATIACLLFIFILQVAVPGATVSIIPTKKEEEMHINVNFMDETIYEESDLWEQNNGMFMIPLTSVFVHESRFTNVSKSFHGENASGTIRLINTTDEDITLKSGTKIVHNKSLTIELPEWVKIPKNGSTIIEIIMPPKDPYGTIIGERGNITAGEKFIIPGLPEQMQEEVYAEVKDEFFGGKSMWKYEISAKDFEKAKKKWEEESREKIEQESIRLITLLQEERGKGFELVVPSSKSIEFEVLEYNFTQTEEELIGKEQGYIDGSIKIRMKTYAYPVDQVIAFIESKYQRIAPDGMVIESINTDLLSSHIQSIHHNSSTIASSFSTRGIYEYSIEEKSKDDRKFLMEAKKSILGERKDNAIDILRNNFVEISEVEIDLSPFLGPNTSGYPRKNSFCNSGITPLLNVQNTFFYSTRKKLPLSPSGKEKSVFKNPLWNFTRNKRYFFIMAC